MRKTFAALAAAAVFSVWNVVAMIPAANADQSNQLQNIGTNLCLGIAGSSTADGAGAVQGDCQGTATQEWAQTGRSLNGDGGVYVQLKNRANKCLGVTNASKNSGAQLVQGNCVTGSTGTDRSQYWHPREADIGVAAYINSWSGLCIGIHNGQQGGPGAHVVQGPCAIPELPDLSQLWVRD